MPASGQMKSIFRTQLDWKWLCRASARMHACRHAMSRIVDAGRSAVAAVGFHAGAAAAQGSEDVEGAEGGKEDVSHTLKSERGTETSVFIRLEGKNHAPNLPANSRRLTLPRSFTGILSTKNIRFGTCQPLRCARQ